MMKIYCRSKYLLKSVTKIIIKFDKALALSVTILLQNEFGARCMIMYFNEETFSSYFQINLFLVRE